MTGTGTPDKAPAGPPAHEAARVPPRGGGASDGPAAETAPAPYLADDVPALRVGMADGRIAAATDALAGLLGLSPAALAGRPLEDLWFAAERAAIGRRFEDVVLLGADRFGAVAVACGDGSPTWVEIEACYRYVGGQRIDVTFVAVQRPPPDKTVDGQASPAAEPDAGSPVHQVQPDAMLLPAAASTARGPAQPDGALLPAEATTARGPAQSGDETALPRVPQPGPALAPDRSLAIVMAVLDGARAAAVAVAPNGTVVSATAECERLLGIPIARLRGGDLVGLVSLSGDAMNALSAARLQRCRQAVVGDLGDGRSAVVLEWIPGDEPGAGYAILAADARTTDPSDAERLQTRLVTFVAHDVRESLASVYCGLRTLADEMPLDAPQRATLERVLHESSRANRIVDDIVAVSRPGRLSRVELDLALVLRETTARYRPRAASAGIEIRESHDPGISVMADLSSLERAFGNLIENAIEATPHAGTLSIASRVEDRALPGVRVSIADTGMGIPPEIQPNLFEPFVTGKTRGTGLGLASTKRIVVDHEGRIDFETEVGRGTTFHIWLPRVGAGGDGQGART